MEFNLNEGTSYIKEFKVTENETAIKMGSGDLEVYATPAMIALMENASKSLVIEELPIGYTTVGIDMSVKHIKSSPIGANIKCKSTLTKVDGKNYFLMWKQVMTKVLSEKVSHIRFIVNSEDFMRKTKKLLK